MTIATMPTTAMANGIHTRVIAGPAPGRRGRSSRVALWSAMVTGYSVPHRAELPLQSLIEQPVTRRSLLGAAAGSAALLATRGLPAWAGRWRSPPACVSPRACRSRASPPEPRAWREIKHIVVLMMENHSFDNLLGMVPHQVPGRGSVDGWRFRHGRTVNFNLDASGNKVIATHGELAVPARGRAEPELERGP